jgi:hypothetical protein
MCISEAEMIINKMEDQPKKSTVRQRRTKPRLVALGFGLLVVGKGNKFPRHPSRDASAFLVLGSNSSASLSLIAE